MDAYFASVEQREQEFLQGKPVAVGGMPPRGVIATAGYEARKFGVRSAMSTALALKKCPQLIVIKPRFELYKAVSLQIRDIFLEYTDLVEPLSLDEAYLDVTENKKGIPSAIKIAKEIKQRIRDELNLSASAGISFNKFLAKVATGINKPDGITFIPPETAIHFLEKLSIDSFYGIGAKTATKMKKLGIHTGKDLKTWTKQELAQQFGKMGLQYYDIVRGIDPRPVVPHRERKSIGTERTFLEDLDDEAGLAEHLFRICTELHKRMHRTQAMGRTITLKVKFFNFKQITRSKTLEKYTSDMDEIYQTAEALLFSDRIEMKKIRLLGVTISHLNGTTIQESNSQLELDLDV